MVQRHDLCKCGAEIVWDTDDDDEQVCKKCGRTYWPDQHTLTYYWLEEDDSTADGEPHKTPPR